MSEPLTFVSCGRPLVGRLHLPRGRVAGERAPGVVLANGLTVSAAMAIEDYAEVLADHGLVALAFDHTGFGRSGGTPERVHDPWLQTRALVDALDALTAHAAVDGARLGLWGESGGAAQALVAAAVDARVRAAVVVVPALAAAVPADAPWSLAGLREGVETACRRVGGPTAGPLAVVTDDPATRAVLPQESAHRWFTTLAKRPEAGWVNEVRLAVEPGPVAFAPVLAAAHVRADALFLVDPDDEVVGSAHAREAFAALPGGRRWVELDGGHFGCGYPGTPPFDRAAAASASFLAERL